VDEYKHAGFRPLSAIRIHPENPDARIIALSRRQKKRSVAVAEHIITNSTIENCGLSATCPVAMHRYTLKSRSVVYNAGSAGK
jgi:hypothetical protein